MVLTYWGDVHGQTKRESEITWPEFCEWLKKVPVQKSKESSPLIKLATFGDAKTERGSLRHDGNVLQVYGIEGDYDSGVVTPEEAVCRLENHQVRAVVVTTFRHTPDKPRWRVFAPLSKPVEPSERLHLAERLNGVLGGILERESGTLSQSYFIGGAEVGEYKVLTTFNDPEDGVYLDEEDGLDIFRIPFATATATAPAIVPDAWTVAEITGRCAFLKNAYENRAALPEPQWWMALGIIARVTPGGRALCHAFSTGHKGYTPQDTDHKILTLMDKAPHTCGYIKQTFDCGKTCGVKTPAQLFYKRTDAPSSISDEDIFKAAFEGQKGAASLFIRLHKDRFCFDHASGIWYTWKSHYWEREPLGEPLKAVDSVAELFRGAGARCKGEIIILGQSAKSGDADKDAELKANIEKLQSRQKACSSQVSNLNSLGYRKQVIEFSAQGPDSLGITGEEWDMHPWFLPCANGVVDLKTGEMRSGAPEDYLKTIAPTPYIPDAPCTRWEQTLREILDGNADLVFFLHRLLGSAIVGAAIEHILPVFHGLGRNGKDTILEGIGYVLGDLAGPVQAELLLDQGRTRSSSGPSADIMALRGRRIAWASETNEGRRLDSGRVKLLTGGGALVGRPPFGRREISFPQAHTLFLLTNAKPHVNADDYALWKRLHLVPFGIAFVDNPQAPNERQKMPHMAEKLKAEASGILAWLVRGCLEWQRQGLNPPAIVKAATDDYRDGEDLLLRFVEDCCEVHHDGEVGAALLYQEYKNWASAMSLKPMSGTAFGRKMGERYTKAHTRLGGFYTGLKLAAVTGVTGLTHNP